MNLSNRRNYRNASNGINQTLTAVNLMQFELDQCVHHRQLLTEIQDMRRQNRITSRNHATQMQQIRIRLDRAERSRRYLTRENRRLQADVQTLQKDNVILQNDNRRLQADVNTLQNNYRAQLNVNRNLFTQIDNLTVRFQNMADRVQGYARAQGMEYCQGPNCNGNEHPTNYNIISNCGDCQ